MAKEKKEKQEKPPGPSKGKNYVFLVASGLMASVFVATTILLIVGMLPTIVASVVDRSRKKTKAVTVGALNFAGCFPFLIELWTQGHSIDHTFTILTTPSDIVVMYAAAAIGYIIDWGLGNLIAGMLYQTAYLRQRSIEQRQAQLIERWGREVTGEIPLDNQGFPLEDVLTKTADLKEKEG